MVLLIGAISNCFDKTKFIYYQMIIAMGQIIVELVVNGLASNEVLIVA